MRLRVFLAIVVAIIGIGFLLFFAFFAALDAPPAILTIKSSDVVKVNVSMLYLDPRAIFLSDKDIVRDASSPVSVDLPRGKRYQLIIEGENVSFLTEFFVGKDGKATYPIKGMTTLDDIMKENGTITVEWWP